MSYNQVPPSPSKINQTDDAVKHQNDGQAHKPIVLHGQGVFTQLPHFYADIWHQLQFVCCDGDEEGVTLQPLISVSSTMLHELPVANLSYEQLTSFSQQWPYCDITTVSELVVCVRTCVCAYVCVCVCVRMRVHVCIVL